MASGRVALRSHGVSHGDAHGRSGRDAVAFEILQNFSRSLDRDTPSGSASGDSGEVCRMESKLGHPRLHPRRQVADSSGVRARGVALTVGST